MDICLGQNKNTYIILCVPPYITMTGTFQWVKLLFLVAGHTKNTGTRLFNSLKKDYQINNVFSFAELIQVCNRNQYITAYKVDWTIFTTTMRSFLHF